MAYTDVVLCNMALSRLGEGRISSLSGTDEVSVLCNLFFEQTRDEVLEDHEWSFALRRTELVAVGTSNLTTYDYKYQVPVDCIKVLGLIDLSDDDYPEMLANPEWVVEDRYLYCDFDDIGLYYISRYVDYSKWSVQAREALVLKLASKLATRISGSIELSNVFLRQYAIQLTHAEGLNTDGAKNPQYASDLWTD